MPTLSDIDEATLRLRFDEALARLDFPFEKSRAEELITSVTPRRHWWGSLYHDAVIEKKRTVHLAHGFYVTEDRKISKFALVHKDEQDRTMIQKKGGGPGTRYFLSGDFVIPTSEVPHYHLEEVMAALESLSSP